MDVWRTNAKLKTNRLKPFLIPIGIESALIIGGFTRNLRTLEESIVRQVEIIDTRMRESYLP